AHRRALAIYRSGTGRVADIALALWYIGCAQQAGGQLDEAERTYLESLQAYRKLQGEENADVADILHALGTVRLGKGDFAQAEQRLTEAVAMRRKLLGDKDKATRATAGELVALYEKRHAAQPGAGYDAKASEWRENLKQWDAAAKSATGD